MNAGSGYVYAIRLEGLKAYDWLKIAARYASSFSRLIHRILLGINGVESLYPISASRTQFVSFSKDFNSAKIDHLLFLLQGVLYRVG